MNFQELFQRLNAPAIAFRPGDVLMYPDSAEFSILLLESGTVEVSRYAQDGSRILQSFMTAPQCLGLIESLTESPVLSGVKAVTAGRYYSLSLKDPLFQKPEVLMLLLRYLASLSEETMRQNAEEKHLSKKDRLAYAIYKNTKAPFPATLPLKREDLADLLAIPKRSLYRYLNELEEEGCVFRKNGKIFVGEEEHKRLGSKMR
ncbi:Crp/Fnr family transcriptional regulator [Peptoniphilus sp. EMRHCC_23]|uniref:Crp/Fnr family transcriptional regulator n=1 Tax=Peptoniphilus rachelemmaiella TaxID=2811779 RepID=UPI001C004EA3|nr:Crp/Fnr family transcriptional regulator [Peptoniphilus rachelemmaiella]